MKESTIEKTVTEYARSVGWLAFKWVSPAQRGVPDRIYFRRGEICIIEFKAPGKIASAYQLSIHRRLFNVGFIVHVVDDIEKGKALLC